MKSYLTLSVRIGAWLLLVMAVLSACVASYFWHDSICCRNEWQKAIATVTALSSEQGAQGPDSLTYAHFTFTTATGQEVTVRSQMASNPPMYKPGEKVEVIYPAAEPEEAEEDLFVVQYILPLALSVEVLFISLLSFIFFRISRKESEHNCHRS